MGENDNEKMKEKKIKQILVVRGLEYGGFDLKVLGRSFLCLFG